MPAECPALHSLSDDLFQPGKHKWQTLSNEWLNDSAKITLLLCNVSAMPRPCKITQTSTNNYKHDCVAMYQILRQVAFVRSMAALATVRAAVVEP